MRRINLASVLLLSTFGLVSGKYISGSISNGQKWVLVSDFSFVEDIGQLKYDVEYSLADECCPSLAYYSHNSYESVSSNDDMDCSSKLSHAEGVFTFQKVLPNVSSNTGNLSTQCSSSNATNLRKCSGKLRLQSTRDRWWFFALSHCNSNNGLDISYELTFTNGDSWERHLSAEEMHSLEYKAVPLAGIILLFVVGLIFAYQLLAQDKLHRAFKLFMMTLSCGVASQVFDYIYYTHYVGNGMPLHPLQTAAELFHSISEVIFVVLLILLPNGWIITTVHFDRGKHMRLKVFLWLYILTYQILFIFKTFFDSETSHIPFESFLDIALRSLRTLAWACFIYGAEFSIQRHPEEKKFYTYFKRFYSVWFLFPPLSALTFSILFDELHQLRYLRLVRLLNPLIYFLGFVGLLFIMRPSKVNINFPFYVRRNEVDTVEAQELSTFQHADAFVDLGNQYATLNTNQIKVETRGRDDKAGLGFHI